MRADGFLRNYAVCGVLAGVFFTARLIGDGMPAGAAVFTGTAGGLMLGLLMALALAFTQERLARAADPLLRLFDRRRGR